MDNNIEIDQNIKSKIDYLILLYLKEIFPYMKFLFIRNGNKDDPKSFIQNIQNNIYIKMYEYCINPKKIFLEIFSQDISNMTSEYKKGNSKPQIIECNDVTILQGKLIHASIINKSMKSYMIDFLKFNETIKPEGNISTIHSYTGMIGDDLKDLVNNYNKKEYREIIENIVNSTEQYEITLNKKTIKPEKLLIKVTSMKSYFKVTADNILRDNAKNKWNKIVNRFVSMADPKNSEQEGYTAMPKDYYNISSSSALRALKDDESLGSFYNASKNKIKAKDNRKGLKQKSLTRDAYINKTKEEINIENIDNKRKLNMVDNYINKNMKKNVAEIIHLTYLGWSDKNISEELNIKFATVRTMKSRAIKELRKNIGKLN